LREKVKENEERLTTLRLLEGEAKNALALEGERMDAAKDALVQIEKEILEIDEKIRQRQARATEIAEKTEALSAREDKIGSELETLRLEKEEKEKAREELIIAQGEILALRGQAQLRLEQEATRLSENEEAFRLLAEGEKNKENILKELEEAKEKALEKIEEIKAEREALHLEMETARAELLALQERVSKAGEESALIRQKQKEYQAEKEKKMAVADFIHSHSTTQAAVALYMQQFAKAEAPDAEVALELLGALRKAQPENRMLLQLDAQQRAALENGVGRKLTPFEVEAMNGDTLSLASYNKPFLISTFAAWSMDFTSILKTIKKLRQNYGEELGFFNVALDADDNKLYFQLERDTLLSVTVCEHKGFDSPIALRLGLSHMPGYILVDKEGVVVKRNINPSQLEAEVRKLLKK
jgi:chromosome segregation ATPase